MTATDLITADPAWYAALVADMAPAVWYGRDGDLLVVTR